MEIDIKVLQRLELWNIFVYLLGARWWIVYIISMYKP